MSDDIGRFRKKSLENQAPAEDRLKQCKRRKAGFWAPVWQGASFLSDAEQSETTATGVLEKSRGVEIHETSLRHGKYPTKSYFFSVRPQRFRLLLCLT